MLDTTWKLDRISFGRKEFLLQVVFAATKAAQATPVVAHYHKRGKDGNPWTNSFMYQLLPPQ